MNILITNDDGIHADGILALRAALSEIGQVHVVAPDRQRSACGHSITLHKPLRLKEVRLADGSTGYACSGTPSDCVSLAMLGALGVEFDVVVSGINHGPNLGWDLTYSGTVSAAMEGTVAGLPSVALSVASYDANVRYETAARVGAQIVRLVSEKSLPDGTLVNVNVPGVPDGEIAGVEVTAAGKRTYEGVLEKRRDPMGRDYYWLGGDVPVDHLVEGTDVYAIAHNRISVTPIHLDLTDRGTLQALGSWGLESLLTSP